MAKPILYSSENLPIGYDEKFLTLPIKNLPEGTVKVRRTICARGFPTAWLENKDGITRKYSLLNGTEFLELRQEFQAEKTDFISTP